MISNFIILFFKFNFGPLIQDLDHWMDSEYVPSEEDFSRLGQEIIISKSTSTAMECRELKTLGPGIRPQDRIGATLEIISFDSNEKSKKFLLAFEDVSAIIFCVPISDYDCFVKSSESKFTIALKISKNFKKVFNFFNEITPFFIKLPLTPLPLTNHPPSL